MNNGKVLSTIGIFIIAPVIMFAYIMGPGSDKGYDRCPDGYEPHLYKNGLCLYESISMRTSANAASGSDLEEEEDEIVIMTHAQLEEFVQREVTNDPFIYGVVSQRDYNKLKTRYDAQKLRMELLKRRNANSWVGIPITALIGVLCCRKIYKMYNK